MFQYSSLAEKPLDQWEIATHWRAFQIQDKSRPHLDQTKFNGLLPLTIDGVLVRANRGPTCQAKGSLVLFVELKAFNQAL